MRRFGDAVVVDQGRADRRTQRREMHLDRRKSDIDVIERVIGGLRPERFRARSDDRVTRSRERRTRG
jgi:hypothetical protein